MSKKIRDGLSKLPPVLDTKISGHGDEKGHLNVRGYDLLELAQKTSFEEASYLLFYEQLPTSDQLNVFSGLLSEKKMHISPLVSTVFSAFDGNEHPTDVITSCLGAMASIRTDPIKPSKEELLDQGISALALYSVLLGGHIGKRNGVHIPFDRKDNTNLITSFTERCFGEQNVLDRAYYINILLTLGSEHGLTTSTFSARNAASARCSFLSAVIAGMQAWHGYRHGTASEFAHKDLLAIQAQGVDPADYYTQQIRQGISPCGFGHRIFKKVKDPRTIFLESLSQEVSQKYGGSLYETAQAAANFFEQKGKFANPDLYVAVLLGSIGFQPKEVSTVVFMGRLAGVCAHIIEENSPMRTLFRGKALYTGPSIQPIIPIAERS